MLIDHQDWKQRLRRRRSDEGTGREKKISEGNTRRRITRRKRRQELGQERELISAVDSIMRRERIKRGRIRLEEANQRQKKSSKTRIEGTRVSNSFFTESSRKARID